MFKVTITTTEGLVIPAFIKPREMASIEDNKLFHYYTLNEEFDIESHYMRGSRVHSLDIIEGVAA
ncbi:hypothetical protein [Bacillus wiedmannii]|uniref:hypothetical protein n=1 Tax=Bacillus wiedmannii TaxID=1890302 RepID=UPI000BF1827A|nr:hypothetical protein [Bacillus wiedmannii]PEM08549.1 hypothetical protein CN610_20060 [Bacillus wiedmannii]